MAKYRVKPGYTYGAYGTFREGDIVELPEKDAGPFLDKLELVPDEVPDAPPDDYPAPATPSPEVVAQAEEAPAEAEPVALPASEPEETVKKPAGRPRKAG